MLYVVSTLFFGGGSRLPITRQYLIKCKLQKVQAGSIKQAHPKYGRSTVRYGNFFVTTTVYIISHQLEFIHH